MVPQKAHCKSIQRPPQPQEAKKLNKQEHSIGDAKQSAGETPAPSRPEYRFIARNTMFPDPRNCTNFTPKARGDSTPCSPHPLSTNMETTTNMPIKTTFITPSTQISHCGDPNADSHRTAPHASPSAAKLTRAYPSPSNHDQPQEPSIAPTAPSAIAPHSHDTKSTDYPTLTAGVYHLVEHYRTLLPTDYSPRKIQ